jgi:hypothetical protein
MSLISVKEARHYSTKIELQSNESYSVKEARHYGTEIELHNNEPYIRKRGSTLQHKN